MESRRNRPPTFRREIFEDRSRTASTYTLVHLGTSYAYNSGSGACSVTGRGGTERPVASTEDPRLVPTSSVGLTVSTSPDLRTSLTPLLAHRPSRSWGNDEGRRFRCRFWGLLSSHFRSPGPFLVSGDFPVRVPGIPARQSTFPHLKGGYPSVDFLPLGRTRTSTPLPVSRSQPGSPQSFPSQ